MHRPSFPDCGRVPASARGFTLTELLVVIAIVGILAAILIPVAGVVRSKASRAECSGNMRGIIAGAQLYTVDHQGKFPQIDDPASGVRSGGVPDASGTGLIDQLFPYVGSIEAFYCAGTPRESSYSFSSQSARTTQRFRQMGYYWLLSPTKGAFGASVTLPQTRMGDPNRVLSVCIYNVGNSGRPHDSNMNIAFADGHIGQLGKGRSISTATLDYNTLLLKK